MRERLTSRPGRREGLALALAGGAVIVAVWIYDSLPILPYDFTFYVNWARDLSKPFYYAYWSLPVFWGLAQLPWQVGFGIFNLLNILGVWLASRLFGGRTTLVLVSFQMLYVILLGSMTGVLVGGLGLAWWGLNRGRWAVAGAGLLIAATKFQLGVTLGLILLALAPGPLRDRLKSLAVPTVVGLVSLTVYPGWPLQILASLQTAPPNDWGSIALWQWIGPAALLVWIPPIVLPLARSERLVALAAANALGLPYFQQTDLLALFVMPVGWLPVALGNLGYLFFSHHFAALRILAVIPVLSYLAVLAPSLRRIGEARGDGGGEARS